LERFLALLVVFLSALWLWAMLHFADPRRKE